MSTEANGPCGSALSEGLGPNAEMPAPFEKPTRSVPLFTAEQMHEYAGACVQSATTDCSAHWRKVLAESCDDERAQMWEAGPGGGCSRAIEADAEVSRLRAELLAIAHLDATMGALRLTAAQPAPPMGKVLAFSNASQDARVADAQTNAEELARLRAENVDLRRLLARYRDETPIVNQPHMIGYAADEALGRA